MLKAIQYHDGLYEAGKPTISDNEYDALTLHLKTLNHCLGSKPANIRSLFPFEGLHIYPMGSLNKAESKDEVIKFLQKGRRLDSPILLQPKLDGIAIELAYQGGRLVHALTRGSKMKRSGVNITHLISLIPAIPDTLSSHHKEVVIHGELYAHYTYSETQQVLSPRHYVAGLINQKDPQRIELQQLQFFPWHWVNSPLSSFRENARQLEKWGFSDTISHTYQVQDIVEIVSLRQNYEIKDKKGVLPLDGVVIKFDNTATQKRLGHRDGTPYWALAWKLPSHSSVSKVSGIRWTIGRTGKITVILDITPTIIKGIEIRSLNVGPIKHFKTLDIAISDSISIALKGAAIPILSKVLVRPAARNFPKLPDPAQYNGMTCMELSDGCREQFIARVQWLTGRNGLDLPGFHYNRINNLVSLGRIKKLQDIFKLEADDIGAEADIILKTPYLSLVQLIRALGIPKVGRKKSGWLAKEGKSWSIISSTSEKQIKQWLKLSSAEASAVKSYLNHPEIKALASYLAPLISNSQLDQ